jgi:hypothetical protein
VRLRLRSHVCTGATAGTGGKTARQTLVKLLHVYPLYFTAERESTGFVLKTYEPEVLKTGMCKSARSW